MVARSNVGLRLAAGLGALALAQHVVADPAPRIVQIRDRQFVRQGTGDPIVMRGPNIVVKGPPYLPSVSGHSICDDHVDDACTKTGTCRSCETFNDADVRHIKRMGWNTIRLGITWAGAQPRDEDKLDPEFLKRLHAILDLTDRTGIAVILDNHGDQVGAAGCGNGLPMWLQKKAAPDLIGKPLQSGLPYSLIPGLEIKGVEGYSACGNNASKWAEFAGDPNYNLLNECCQAVNGPNPTQLGYTTISQRSMDYVLFGEGRADFLRYWKLVVAEVVDHPSAFAAELMNEPQSVHRKELYALWRDTAVAINAVIPDMSVAVCDLYENPSLPQWVSKIGGNGLAIGDETVQFLKESKTLFYAFHWYGFPKDPARAVQSVQAVSADWNMPVFLTEFFECGAWTAAEAANISLTYWHYSAYCTTGAAFGNRTVPGQTFGACILGWTGGDSSRTCDVKEIDNATIVV